MKYQKPRGTSEILPSAFSIWQNVRYIFDKISNLFCFEKINTPTFEMAELFNRTIGEESDIVSKEMFIFQDKKGRTFALRPEATAGIVRSVVENKLLEDHKLPLKVAYWENMFRYDRPQKGRNREFWQCGAEIFDKNNVANDIEIISMVNTFLISLRLKEWTFKINFIGGKETKKKYCGYIIDFIGSQIETFCDDCKKRILKSPLKILDCKADKNNIVLRNMKSINSFLSEQEATRLAEIKLLLSNLQIKYTEDSRLVRGLDYYNDFIFEVVSTREENENNSLLGGGRYNHLVEEIGGPKGIAGVGFSIGVERLLWQMHIEDSFPKDGYANKLFLYIGLLNSGSYVLGTLLSTILRQNGLRVAMSDTEIDIKTGYKNAERQKAANIVFLGNKDLERQTIIVKNLDTKKETEFAFEKIEEMIGFLIDERK